MAKYNVGDKVLIRDDLVVDEEYDGCLFVLSMVNGRGKQAKIIKMRTLPTDPSKIRYRLDIDNGTWSWSDPMLLPCRKQFNNLLRRGE